MNTDPPHSCNLLINLGGEPFQISGLEASLKSKPGQKETPFYCIDLKNKGLAQNLSPKEIEIFSKIDNMSRVYILDHGTPNSNHIQSAHYSTLAEWLSKNLSNKSLVFNPNEKEDQQHLKISLLSCNSGVGGKSHESNFASQLHYELGKVYNKNVDVVARRGIAYTGSNEAKYTSGFFKFIKLNLLNKLNIKVDYRKAFKKYHKVAGSKIRFTWNSKGEQIAVDSYVESFRKKIINEFNQLKGLALEKESLKELDKNKEILTRKGPIKKKEIEAIQKSIKNIYKKVTDTNTSKTLIKIEEILEKSKKSIGKNSIPATKTGRSLNNDYQTINTCIIKEIHSPIIEKLKGMIKDEKRADKPGLFH